VRSLAVHLLGTQQAGKWLRSVTKTSKQAVNAVMVHTAAVYFQRFYATRSFRRWDRWYTSAACLLLASKVEECQCSIALVLRAVNSVRTGLSQAETLAETALEVGGAPDAAAAAAAAAPRRHEVPIQLCRLALVLRSTALRRFAFHFTSDLLLMYKRHGQAAAAANLSTYADALLIVKCATVYARISCCNRHGQRGRQAV
jgi:Cyclin, N-terminal domain